MLVRFHGVRGSTPCHGDEIARYGGNTSCVSVVADGEDPLWALADQIARLRAADATQLELVQELLAVLVRRAERARAGRPR